MTEYKRILIVEDDPLDVELIINTLKENNIVNKVDVASDGAQALDYLYCRGEFAGKEAEYPAVVLLDLKMPKLNGIEVLREIKSDEKLKPLPVVILTSSRESQDLNECYKLGANAYVVKPVKFEEFVTAVKELGVFWALINEPPEEFSK